MNLNGPRYQETLSMNIDDEDDIGVVFRKTLGQYTVHKDGREIDCVLSSLNHKQLIYPTADPTSLRHAVREVREIEHVDPIAIGDRVRYVDAGDSRGMIMEILPRRSKLSRPALLDRYLVTAEAAGLPVLIIITKLDLAEKNLNFDADIEVYRRIGYPVQLVSSVTGEGIEGLKQALQGHMSVLVGKSGVGKTSLLNVIQPGLGLRVKAVSRGEQGKGRHTTSHLEMFGLDIGGTLVDTPGMREFGLWEIASEELAYLFPEMARRVGQCKFGMSCHHDQEPGCAIRKAVMSGEISPQRYKSYIHLKEEL
jgi:ribosome small subunit-dependent GTPase A